MKNDLVLIKFIIESIDKVREYITGMDFVTFEADNKTVSAVIRELTVIGEAAASLSEEFKEEHNQIPFHEVIGMRNRIVHEYWAVDVEVVWKTCREDLSKLMDLLKDVE